MNDIQPKYPNVEVPLSGEDGNASFIIGRVARALRRAGVDSSEIYQFTDEATDGNYDHTLRTCMAWVTTS